LLRSLDRSHRTEIAGLVHCGVCGEFLKEPKKDDEQGTSTPFLSSLLSAFWPSDNIVLGQLLCGHYYCDVMCMVKIDNITSVTCTFCARVSDLAAAQIERPAKDIGKFIDAMKNRFECVKCKCSHPTENDAREIRGFVMKEKKCVWCTLEDRDVFVA
ncbi:hypothetical protein PFISCL1PPCAC_105, partial [Pristionchus fissidentatus]